MKFKRPQTAPLIWAVGVLVLVCGLRLWQPDFLQRVELMTYDARVRAAARFSAPTATNLAFVSMEDSSIAVIKRGLLGKPGFGLYWPRQVYGRLVEELSAQQAKAIAFDVLFGELRQDHPPVQMADGSIIESDDFFALQMRRAGNVITAFTSDVIPPDLFITNSLALGDISTDKDSDGVLRRIKSFSLRWHPAFRSAARQLGADLEHARIDPDKIVVPVPGTNITVKLNRDGNFDLADFVGDAIPRGWKRFDKPFTRVWDLGIVLAAQELKLNLDQAVLDLPHGKITLPGANGIVRVIPVDGAGYFYINWQLTPGNAALTRAPMEAVLKEDIQRLHGETNDLRNNFAGKLVVIGSAAKGNDLTDRGATPLEKDTLLVSKHWNVANSLITDDFIHQPSLVLELLIIIVLGTLTAMATWQMRAVAASTSVALLMLLYAGLAYAVFVHSRLWLPLFYPLAGAVLLQHILLMTHRIYFEEQDKRRVKSLFSKMISPEIMNELLQADKLSLGGTHREITVFFADVRGFTTLTDQMQESVAEFVRNHNVDIETAEKYFEESARETLEIVNLYLSVVAEAVKKNGGILDKYIGDCVMAFWNAPVTEERHAVAAVRAAIDAQRAIHSLNLKREAENPLREQENRERLAAGRPPRPLHASLYLGTGINTGYVTVGLMGSDEHGFNYTVFGREVNLASRLEGLSGSGRIIISDLTYFQLLRHAPELAGSCMELFPEKVKGFRDAVRIYEVPWQSK
ncbi:MAG TPA: adenylate/guanylate cyclase domain-containing protein [Verrucomicrobiae bacterium]